MQIPLCDLTQQYFALKSEIDAAMQDVAANGRYILGPNVSALEQEIADYCQCRYAVAVNSGTDALHLALLALQIGPGDEVITTPFTFIATSEAIRMVGATPVFVDIDPQTYNLDTTAIESAISPKTRAILPVHLFGQPCNMREIVRLAENHSLSIVEDCAQALGATFDGRKVGSFGAAGCLSFFPSKNLGCFGDGGMVVTNDEQVYERVEVLRRHGGKIKYHHECQGVNSRLDELQAAILRIKLRHLENWNNQRRQKAHNYNQLLAEVGSIQRPAEFCWHGNVVPAQLDSAGEMANRHVYHQYTVAIDNRGQVAAKLSEFGIGCAVYYPVPLHLQKINSDLPYGPGSFPVAEQLAECCLSLPMYPELPESQQLYVANQLKQIVAKIIDQTLAA